MRTMSKVACVGVLTTIVPQVLAQQAADYFYLFEGQRMMLGIDSSRVAAFSADGLDANQPLSAGNNRASLVVLGQASAHPVPGWMTVAIDTGANRAAGGGIEQAVADLARANPTTFISPVFEDQYGPLLITQNLLIEFHADIFEAEADQLIADLGLGVVLDRDFHGIPGLYRVRSSSNNGFEVLNQANRTTGFPEVRYAEPDMVMTAQLELIPNDQDFNQLWGLNNVGQNGGQFDFDMDGPEAWDITTGDPSIIVTIMDNGMDMTHPDINSIPGIDMTGTTADGSHDPSNPCDGHGTLVGGTIAGRINNNIGVAGIAPACRVAPTKVFLSNQPCDGSGQIQTSWITGAINWAVNNGGRVTNTSLSYGSSGAILSAFQNSATQGLVHFASSGNGGNTGFVAFPGSASSVISIGATTRFGQRAGFSQTGPNLGMVAPGASIRTTARGGGYATVNGTSFSSPYSAGVAALIFSLNPILTNADVTQIMENSAVDMGTPGWDAQTGFGHVNANQALLITPLPGPPQSFELLSPSLGQTNVSVRPTLNWGSSTNAFSYLLEVDNNSDFSSPEVSVTLPSSSSTTYIHPGPDFPTATTFSWRVTSTNPLGTANSSTWTFTTLSDPPGNFALDMPANLAASVDQLPSFAWFPSSLAADYVLTLSQSSDLSNPLIVQVVTGTTFTATTPLDPLTTYYWSVVARNAIGNTTSSPLVRQFNTIAAAPLAFNLLTPVDSDLVTARDQVFDWSDSIGAAAYTLTIDDNSDFSSPTFVETGLMASMTQLVPGTLANGTIYSWKVEALNVSGSTLALFSPRLFVTSFSACEGDGNFDGIVNFSDVTTVLTNWGNDYGFGTGFGDALPDGLVRFSDITAVLSGWLQVCP